MIESIWHILLELAPWLLVGAGIAGILHAVLPADFMRRHLQGRWGVLKAAALGVPMPLCSCSVIPVGLGLKKQGASDGATVAFLVSTPQTGVDSVLVSTAFLGLPFTLFKLASALVIGLVGGWWTDAAAARRPALPTVDAASPACEAPRSGGVRGIVQYALMLLRSIWGWLAVGVIASAAIEVFLPAEGLQQFAAYGALAAMAAALVVSTPLYVCAIASVPIAASLVAKGLPPSAALVFLIAGPATNIATIGAVYRTLGRRTLAIYLASIIAGSMLCGWAFSSLVASADPLALHHHHAAPWWAAASAAGLLVLFAWFAWQDAAKWARTSRWAPASKAPSIEIPVAGMVCQNCASRLEREIAAEQGIVAVDVSLAAGMARVTGEVSSQRLRELIAGAGFQPQ